MTFWEGFIVNALPTSSVSLEGICGATEERTEGHLGQKMSDESPYSPLLSMLFDILSSSGGERFVCNQLTV